MKDTFNKITKIAGIIIVFITTLFVLSACTAGSTGDKSKTGNNLEFVTVNNDVAKQIKKDLPKFFGTKALDVGSAIGVGYMPSSYTAVKINDQYGIYTANAKQKLVKLDGAKINTFVGNKFFADVFSYQKDDDKYRSTNSGFYFYDALEEKIGASDESNIMFVDITPIEVQYNKKRKDYRVQATGETTWMPLDHGGQKIPVVIYLDSDFNITDVLYGKKLSDLDGNLSKSTIQKGIQGINQLSADLASGKITTEEALNKQVTGPQVVAMNETYSWIMTNRVLMSYRNQPYVDGKLLENFIPEYDADGNPLNEAEYKAATTKYNDAQNIEAGGKINSEKLIDEKVESVNFDSKKQLTRVVTKATVSLENGKKGIYKQTYYLDENYVIRVNYVGTNQPE